MTDTIPESIRTLANQLMSQEGGLEQVCGKDAPEEPHPNGGSYKSQCNMCLQKEEGKEICVAQLITDYMSSDNR